MQTNTLTNAIPLPSRPRPGRPPKLDFEEAFERLSEGRILSHDQVRAADLRRVVYLSAWGLPGCLYETQDYHLTKEDAIRTALLYAEGSQEDGTSPRGLQENLRRCGYFRHKTAMYGEVCTIVRKMTLADAI